MGLRKEGEIGFFGGERDGRMGYWGREWRDLMFDMSGLTIKGVLGEFISIPFEERECLHVAHHYTLGRL